MKAWTIVLAESKDKNLRIFKMLRRWKKEYLHTHDTAVTRGTIDKELLKVTPIFLAVVFAERFSVEWIEHRSEHWTLNSEHQETKEMKKMKKFNVSLYKILNSTLEENVL